SRELYCCDGSKAAASIRGNAEITCWRSLRRVAPKNHFDCTVGRQNHKRRARRNRTNGADSEGSGTRCLECWQQRGSRIAASLPPAKDDRQSRVSPDIWACLGGNSELSMSRSGRGMIVRSLDRLQLANVQGHETGSG